MKKLFLLLVILTGIAISCTRHQKATSRFDFSSLNPFWSITELLQKDSSPSDSLWNRLFETPGYQTLTTIEYPKDWIKSYLSGGIKPSERPVYNEWVSKGYWDTVFCLHMQEAASRRAEVEGFVKILQSGQFMDQALTDLREFWPNGDTLDEIPPISFIFFNRDARGYDPILIDLLFAMDLYQQDELDEMIAHEAHHYYRKKVLSFTYPPEQNPDHTLINTLDQVHLEGLADQIDKPGMFANPLNAKRSAAYQKLLMNTSKDISILDSLLTGYSSTPDSLKIKVAGQIQRSTPNSGHPMGYFMSTAILKYLGKDSLLQDIGNPFAYFRRYNRAAVKSQSQLPLFSDAALHMISELEAKYSK